MILGYIKTNFQEADDRTYKVVTINLQGGLKRNMVTYEEYYILIEG